MNIDLFDCDPIVIDTSFEVERVLIDGSVVNAQDVMAILKLIKEKEVTVNSAAFR